MTKTWKLRTGILRRRTISLARNWLITLPQTEFSKTLKMFWRPFSDPFCLFLPKRSEFRPVFANSDPLAITGPTLVTHVNAQVAEKAGNVLPQTLQFSEITLVDSRKGPRDCQMGRSMHQAWLCNNRNLYTWRCTDDQCTCWGFLIHHPCLHQTSHQRSDCTIWNSAPLADI